MAGLLENLSRITDAQIPDDARRFAIRDFAERLNWTPSYELNAPIESAGVFNHVIVEHGLANSAVISFLRGSARASDLSPNQLRSLLAISYNNMIEWHYFVSQHDARRVYNLIDPSSSGASDEILLTNAPDLERFLSSSRFALESGSRRIKPQERACDDALIDVVSRWKRLLATEVEGVTTKQISTLFNAIIFIRGCEDRNLRESLQRGSAPLLRNLWAFDGTVDVPALIRSSFDETGVIGDIAEYIDFDQLAPFRVLDKSTAANLLKDFYDPREAPYTLNFALMSKHALSRIYERFVSILIEDPSAADQISFLPKPAVEVSQRKTGAIYTPQFIASFFARYVRENTTPRQFRELRTLDPACGSGIFLRTILEEQCNPFDPSISSNTITEMFRRTTGVDKDGNALEATRLSLALLHLVSTDRLPPHLDLREDDSIALAQQGALAEGGFDVVLTNPPYIKLDHLPADTREIYLKYLGPDFLGRLDAYIPFMKLCLTCLSEDGFACFVIPQTFLQARNAEFIRKQISIDFDVRCLIDLSAVDVFEGIGAYSILLIVQKKRQVGGGVRQEALVGQATEFVGAALQSVLDGREASTAYYRVFRSNQAYFSDSKWTIRPPEIVEFDRRLRILPRLSDYLECFQGFVTGADDVFIRPKSNIAIDERRIYMDYLPDRRIGRFVVPSSVEQMVLYPYMDDRLIKEAELQELFPETWAHLVESRLKLQARRRSPSTPWWKPERPRDPDRMKRPKIVCPHLMLTPRFAIDTKGRFATKHGPIMIAKIESEQQLTLKFFCAVLNSSIGAWYIRTHVPTFSRGYSRLEPATLKSMPVPDLADVGTPLLREVGQLVDDASQSRVAEQRIDQIMQKLYRLRDEELAIVGIRAT